jgi:hypothetical protein
LKEAKNRDQEKQPTRRREREDGVRRREKEEGTKKRKRENSERGEGAKGSVQSYEKAERKEGREGKSMNKDRTVHACVLERGKKEIHGRKRKGRPEEATDRRAAPAPVRSTCTCNLRTHSGN